MKIVAVTACPTGIAHCELAADRLERAAAERGIELEVEISGAAGVSNELSESDVRRAAVAILAVDVDVNTERFASMPTVRCSTGDVIEDADGVLERAIDRADDAGTATDESSGTN